MRLFVCAVALAIGARAQPLSIGFKAGAALTGDLDSFWAATESKRLTFGPMAVVRLGHGFAVEIDALYNRAGYRVETSFFNLSYTYTRARGNSWTFPLLLRRSVAGAAYVAAGYAPRVINGHQSVTSVQATAADASSYQTASAEYPGEWQTAHGVIGAAGVEGRVGRLRVGPEVRYTWWGTPSLEVYGSRGFSILSERHQVEIFVGIRF